MRHSIVMLLLGWYLLLPANGSSNGELIHNTRAPLSQWLNISSFDTARECEHGKAAIMARGPDPEPSPIWDPNYVNDWAEAVRSGSDMVQWSAQWDARRHAKWLARVEHDQLGWALSRCVPTDDPRLKSR